MKTTVNVYDFRDAFKRFDRDNFSYHGLGALFEYLEEYEDSTGQEIELDVVAICCDFSEYDTPEAAASEYGWEFEDGDALEWLQDQTTAIPWESVNLDGVREGGIIVAGF
jgi:hypothetical protein